MKKVSFFLLLFLNAFIYPQEKRDSIFLHREAPQLDRLFEKIDDINFLFDMKSAEREILFNENSESVWLQTYYSLRYTPVSGQNLLPSHLTMPLYQEYIRNSRFDPVRAALGLAQMGAAGYLAYRAVKKHGFFR